MGVHGRRCPACGSWDHRQRHPGIESACCPAKWMLLGSGGFRGMWPRPHGLEPRCHPRRRSRPLPPQPPVLAAGAVPGPACSGHLTHLEPLSVIPADGQHSLLWPRSALLWTRAFPLPSTNAAFVSGAAVTPVRTSTFACRVTAAVPESVFIHFGTCALSMTSVTEGPLSFLLRDQGTLGGPDTDVDCPSFLSWEQDPPCMLRLSAWCLTDFQSLPGVVDSLPPAL